MKEMALVFNDLHSVRRRLNETAHGIYSGARRCNIRLASHYGSVAIDKLLLYTSMTMDGNLHIPRAATEAYISTTAFLLDGQVLVVSFPNFPIRHQVLESETFRYAEYSTTVLNLPIIIASFSLILV